MGTEVLRPHDVLPDRFRFPQTTPFHRRKNGNLTNLIVEKKPHNNAKKTSPRPDKKKPNTAVPRRKDDINNTNHILSSQVKKVTLLRRGESLDSLNSAKQNNNNKEIMKSPNRKPVDDLIMMPKQIRISGKPMGDTYAGSAFSMSPSPRSLPVPSFFNNKHMIMNEDSVTRDLRRLLRLE